MAKQTKHNKKKDTTQEVVIREGQYKKTAPKDISHEDYYEADEDKAAVDKGMVGKAKRSRKPRPPKLTPKLIIRIALISLVSILALMIFLNRDNFAPENLALWFKTKLMGAGVGDGYPVPVKGTTADPGNFLDADGNVFVLSDTSLTTLNSTGRELYYFRHSYNSPAMVYAQNRFLLYNVGGTGYSLISGDGSADKKTMQDKITAGAIAKNGRYALVTQPSDYASQLNVFLPGGTLKATYKLADSYISAVAINGDGTGGVVSALQSENGKLSSHIYVYDFNEEEPVAEYVSENNLITGITYNHLGGIYAVGDKQAVISDSAGKFQEYDYGGRIVTAAALEGTTALISVSSYQRGGPCTVLIFSEGATPQEVPTETFVTDLSGHGTSFAALMGDTVYSFRYDGTPLGQCDAGYDAKAITLSNERDVYILGVREVRFASLQKEDVPVSGGQTQSSSSSQAAGAGEAATPAPTVQPTVTPASSGE